MHAVRLGEFGPPAGLVLEHVPDPVVEPDQVLIDVVAASVTFVETQIRAGRGPNPAGQPALPWVPGNGVGGTVAEVGARVDPGLVGTRVISTTGGSGGYAEQVAVSAAELIPIPDGLDLYTAVALLADGRTAVGLSQLVAPAPGEWVLVEAAGGGVGSLLVQLASRAGAKVIGAAGAPEKLAVAADVGAQVTVDYTQPDWADEIRAATAGAGVDAVFDGVGGRIGQQAFELLRDGGRMCIAGMASGSMTQPDPQEVERRGLSVLGLGDLALTPPTMRELTRAALDLAVGRELRPTIGQIYSLDDAATAHAAIEARATLGKTLLIVSPDGEGTDDHELSAKLRRLTTGLSSARSAKTI